MKRLFKVFLLSTVALLPLISCGGKDNPVVNPTPEPTPDPTPETPVEVTFDVPDKAGMNIKGVVYCGQKPLENVIVSDGDEVTKTDKNGHYYLKSTKSNKSVFVSTPAGYIPKTDGIWPSYFSTLSKAASETEQVNFELVEKDQSNHVVIGLADIHIANVRETVRQYTDNFLPDLNKVINDYKISGKDVYVLCLGDQSHDLYWYDNGGIDLEGSKPYLSRINCSQMYTVMGNHDNDPYITDDFMASARYRVTYGPTHYSFNIGDTHYIMLDNIVYINTGGSQGKLGEREYNQTLTTDQLNWMRKDLSYVSKSTPVVVCMHAPLWKKPSLSGSAQTSTPKAHTTNANDIISVLSGYNATFLTGHAHINSRNQSGSIEEYNVASGAGRLWYSGQNKYGAQHLCGDGVPAGYLVMEMSGKSKNVFYKGVAHDKDYQFRTYDLNCCHITAAKYCPASTDAIIKSKLVNGSDNYISGYENARTDNVVRINVFGYKESWKIKVTENGKELKTTRLYGYDPLWTISVPCRQLQNRESSVQEPTKNAHLFECQASSATSTLIIEVQDDYGHIYKETMTRPKQLEINMN